MSGACQDFVTGVLYDRLRLKPGTTVSLVTSQFFVLGMGGERGIADTNLVRGYLLDVPEWFAVSRVFLVVDRSIAPPDYKNLCDRCNWELLMGNRVQRRSPVRFDGLLADVESTLSAVREDPDKVASLGIISAHEVDPPVFIPPDLAFYGQLNQSQNFTLDPEGSGLDISMILYGIHGRGRR